MCKCSSDVLLEINSWSSWYSGMNRLRSASQCLLTRSASWCCHLEKKGYGSLMAGRTDLVAVSGYGWRKGIRAQSLTQTLFFQCVFFQSRELQ